jgi:hypothetical protein
MATVRVKALAFAKEGLGPLKLAGEEKHKIVVERHEEVVVSLADANFPTGGSILLPAPEREDLKPGDLRIPTSMAALAAALKYAEKNAGKKLLVAGHTDTVGSASSNQELSELRARSVHLILAGKPSDWAALSLKHHRPFDLQLLLTWLSMWFGYDCATPVDGKMGPKTKRALDRYRRAVRAAGMSPGEDKAPLAVADWETFAKHYDTVLAGALKIEPDALAGARGKLAFTTPPALGFGERKPADGDSTDGKARPSNRRVELLFFPPDAVPPLETPKGADLSYSKRVYKRIHLPVDPERDILLRLVSVDGAPIADQKYVVTFADGSKREGKLSKAGTDLIVDPPEGPFTVEYPEHDAIRDKALAARMRHALEEGDLPLVAGTLCQPAAIVQRAAKIYDQDYNDISGKGLVKDIQLIVDGTDQEKPFDYLLVEAGLVKRPRPKPRPRPPAPKVALPAPSSSPLAAMAPKAPPPEEEEEKETHRIVGVPACRVLSPGAKITYRIESTEPGGGEPPKGRWFCLNDPSTVTYFKPAFFNGPFNSHKWENASWTRVGRHTVVCRLELPGGAVDYKLTQVVAPLSGFLSASLPMNKEDPEAVLDGLRRYIDLLVKIGREAPPADPKKLEEHKTTVAHFEEYRDRLQERLAGSDNRRRYPIMAEHFDAASQQRRALRIFAFKKSPNHWVLVDWTNPTTRSTTGEYDGHGATPEEALRDAFEDWDEDNRYPPGGIMYSVDKIPRIQPFADTFETDGESTWDSVAKIFEYIGLGAAVVAGVITLIAPVPGSQVVSALIWTSILSGTGSAALNIGQRHAEGFTDWKSDAFDVLSIAGNLFVGGKLATQAWKQGAKLTIKSVAGNTMKAVLIGEVATDGLQGVLVAVDHVDQLKKVLGDTSLTPQERIGRMAELVRSLTIAGTLLVVNVRGTKADLDSLKSTLHGKVPPPEQRLKQLADEHADVDVTKVPQVEGDTKQNTHTTTVHLDQEAHAPRVPHVDGPRARSFSEQIEDAMGSQQYNQFKVWAERIKAARPDLAHITDDELIALRGYTTEDYKFLNKALWTKDDAALRTLQAYIEAASAAIKKLPKHKGHVTRGMKDMTPEKMKQFRVGDEWETQAFMSTSIGAEFDGNCKMFVYSKSGVKIHDLSAHPKEAEVLIGPGARFKVLKVTEPTPGEYEVYLREV